jgi:hypothetical protein
VLSDKIDQRMILGLVALAGGVLVSAVVVVYLLARWIGWM